MVINEYASETSVGDSALNFQLDEYDELIATEPTICFLLPRDYFETLYSLNRVVEARYQFFNEKFRFLFAQWDPLKLRRFV
jgi:signal-transduction protein with cAMP-binding, CBS, and nucleotidyltransferase domain